MAKELLALESKQARDLVLKPVSGSIIGSKWVYSLKIKFDGTLERYKAWLASQGFKQEYGIDYEKTFAPMAKILSGLF